MEKYTVYLVNEDSSKTLLTTTSTMADATTFISAQDQSNVYSVEHVNEDGNIDIIF